MKLVVTRCEECPFFQAMPTLDFLLKLVGNGMKGGTCSYDRETNSVVLIKLGLPEGVEREKMIAQVKRRVVVDDRTTIPAGCPIRNEPITVTLGS